MGLVHRTSEDRRQAGCARSGALACVFAWSVACTGSIGESGDGTPLPGAEGSGEPGVPGAPRVESCERLEVGPSLLPRMTRTAYNHTVEDLLGTGLSPADRFPADESEDFDNAANAHRVSLLLAEGYATAAAELAQAATANVVSLVGCEPDAVGCIRSFIEDFGLRAYRRPLAAAEVEEHFALYDAFAAEDGPEAAVALLVETFLRSPFFLYRVEEGEPVVGNPHVRKLTGYEVATRLSYFLWRTMPDEELFDAAEAGRACDVGAGRKSGASHVDGPPSPSHVGGLPRPVAWPL